MAIIEKRFGGAQVGQVWSRLSLSTTAWPDILVLAVGTRSGIAKPCVKARICDGRNNLVGSTAFCLPLENVYHDYKYLGVLKPSMPHLGQVLTGLTVDKPHWLVTEVCPGADSFQVNLWNPDTRCVIPGSTVHSFPLDDTLWKKVAVYWSKGS